MNQLKKYFAILVIAFAFTPIQTQAKAKDAQTINIIASQKAMSRLNEINSMDKSHLTSLEKKELRKEVLEIRERSNPGGGIYISVGALIIIILLLIILF